MKKSHIVILSIIGIAALVLIYFIIAVEDDSSVSESINTVVVNQEEDMTMAEKTYAFPGVLPDERIKNKKVRISTQKGDIVFELYPEDAPKAASNFVYLAEQGYYDGVTFHRVEPGFVIQGGDPNGTGAGGPGYEFEDETVSRDYKQGIVAMANAGPDTNGSQFFIMLEDKLDMPKLYTVFGNVLEGQEIVQQIVVGDIMEKVTVEDL